MITKEYAITILNKVSFDKKLFRKELNKFLKWLDDKDRIIIKKWAKKKYHIGYVKL